MRMTNTWHRANTVDLLPHDEFNSALLANVHPADWKNPTPDGRYHLVVIGAGTAGLVTAAGAAGLGAKVALVERNLMGGDCLNVGCVPSKGIIRAARAMQAVRRAGDRVDLPLRRRTEHLGEQVGLRREVSVDAAGGDAVPLGDGGDRAAGIPALGHDLQRRRDRPVARRLPGWR